MSSYESMEQSSIFYFLNSTRRESYSTSRPLVLSDLMAPIAGGVRHLVGSAEIQEVYTWMRELRIYHQQRIGLCRRSVSGWIARKILLRSGVNGPKTVHNA